MPSYGDPTNSKIHVQAWLPADAFATVIDWLGQTGEPPSSLASAVVMAIDELATILIEHGQSPIVGEHEVQRVFNSMRQIRQRQRGLSRLAQSQVKQSAPREQQPMRRESPAPSNIDPAHVAAALAMLNKVAPLSDESDSGEFDPRKLREQEGL